jgi:Lamin Tail Domain/CotH kinase protein/Bacterial TSP3 repeat
MIHSRESMGHLTRLIRYFLGVSLCAAAVLPSSGQIVINEIHYNPDVKTEAVEFIELYNRGASAVNLSGWQLTDAVSFTIPNGTVLDAGGYLVIAQNPIALQSKFGVAALGSWIGKLSNEGDKIVLKNAADGVEDEVNYQLGFPWPTVGDPPGYSIELVNPAFDNDLGGNWRASVAGNPAQQSQTLIPDHSTWKYLKGFGEASSPTTTWRLLNFDDSTWLSGPATIGYGESFISTLLGDMQGNYTTVFFRRQFVVDNPSAVSGLVLEAQYDDGIKVWINGTNVLNANISTGEVPFNGTATSTSRENYTYDSFNLSAPQSYLVTGTNVIAIQGVNGSLSGSSDFFMDMRLLVQTGSGGHGPTPGAMNSVYATNAPPQIRQVNHSPNEPGSGLPVTITAKITDPEGVSAVMLQYQIVTPGNYIELADAAYTNNWTTVAMNDSGINGDELAGDSVFTVVIPASVQQHRRLIRYRISVTDGAGSSVTVPYPDDPQPNFAYFCYDGVPAWQGAVQPGVTTNLTFNTNVMRRLPVVHLISKSNSVINATWFNRYMGDLYLWSGTLVYDGKVYDHIHYRARGGGWRYAMVKNMWKFDFNRGHDFPMRDDYGHKYDVKWTKLNLGACIQQNWSGHRGEQGMFESVGSRLFNLAGVEAFNTSFLQFRIIDDAAESTPVNQYEGDFWGLYLAVEQEDGCFLDEHGLPDGNFYKMENGTGELNNIGPLGPTDKSDLSYILGNYTGATDAWWRTNWVLSDYYSYQAIVQAIHHYDINDNKNYFYHRNPETGLWKIIPWDLDLTWAHNMYLSSWGGLNTLASHILQATAEVGTGSQIGTSNLKLTGARPAFELEFRNRIREIRDLLFNTNQAWQLIDEYALLLRGPTNAPTFLDADRCMWDYNPKMISSAYSSDLWQAGQGKFYQWPNEPTVSKDFNGCIQLMKNYVVVRGEHLDSLASDAAIPSQPTLTYIGTSNYPLSRLTYRSCAYSGSAAFAAMKWRVGEVWDTNAPAFDPAEPQPYEITATWESPEITNFNSDITIPAEVLKVGHAYRVRVRMKDVTGRWSRWSAPVQFISTQPENAAALVSYLRITELMYNPPAGSDYEFIELHNTSTNLTLDLTGAAFTSGVNFNFPVGTNIPPDGYLLLVRNASTSAFRSHYGLSPSVPVVGPYAGSLANEGEQLTFKTAPGGSEISSFEFGNGRGWPLAAEGAGHSLVPVDPNAPGQATGALDYPGNWRASTYINGSPGQADPVTPAPTVLLNEIVAHTDYTNAARPEYDSDDWIELYNTTSTNINLSGWYLSDDPANPAKWAIPVITIPARGWITFDEVNDFHNPITTGFGLDKAGEQVLLSYLPGTAANRVVDAIAFKGQENEVALARYSDGAPFWYATARTRNSTNTAPLSGLRFTEIMYHPPDLGTNDNTRDEFIELFNLTAVPVTLQNALGAWRLDGGVNYTFPTNTIIPAGGTLLIVNFAPSDTVTSNAFRAAYGITNVSLRLVGPYSGKLGNRSDRVALERPQFPDLPGDPYSWVIVDEVIYGNQNPWPANANGGGSALQRISVNQHGNDPANWHAGAPTPGDTSADRDGDGLPNDWEVAHSLNPDNPADAALDSDGDGLSNFQEFLCGTDPQDKTSFLGFDSTTCSNAVVILCFTAVADRSYSVQYRDSLSTGLWQNLTNISAEPFTRQMTISDPFDGGISNRYYRLVTPATP